MASTPALRFPLARCALRISSGCRRWWWCVLALVLPAPPPSDSDQPISWSGSDWRKIAPHLPDLVRRRPSSQPVVPTKHIRACRSPRRAARRVSRWWRAAGLLVRSAGGSPGSNSRRPSGRLQAPTADRRPVWPKADRRLSAKSFLYRTRKPWSFGRDRKSCSFPSKSDPLHALTYIPGPSPERHSTAAFSLRITNGCASLTPLRDCESPIFGIVPLRNPTAHDSHDVYASIQDKIEERIEDAIRIRRRS